MGDLEEREEKKIDLHQIATFVGRYRLVYIACILALAGSLYTLYNIEDYQEKCNAHWVDQFESKGCACGVNMISPFNDSFVLAVPFIDDKSNDNGAHIIVPNSTIDEVWR